MFLNHTSVFLFSKKPGFLTTRVFMKKPVLFENPGFLKPGLDGEEVKTEFFRLVEEYPCPIHSWFERERESHMKRFEVINGDDMI